MRLIPFCFLFFVQSALYAQRHTVTPLFKLKEERAIVEGMTYDPVGRNFYFGNSVTHRILKYSHDGKTSSAIGDSTDGITSLLGMSVDTKTNQLWVCGAIKANEKQVMTVFQYDLKSGKLLQRYPDTSGKAKLFNDVTITNDGSVFVTDSYERSLYKVDVASRNAVLFIKSDSLRDANGITTDGEHLFVSTYPGITKVHPLTRTISKLKLKDYHIAGSDGLYYYNNSVIGIQNVFYPLSVVRYYFDDAKSTIERAEVLSVAHPSFVIPTTGAISDNVLYMMSNNNIGREGEQKLEKVALVKISL